MAHLPPIVSDLAMILLVAGITTILFKKLNQPQSTACTRIHRCRFYYRPAFFLFPDGYGF